MHRSRLFQLGLLSLSTLLAVLLGFVCFDASTAVSLIKAGAYWTLLLTFALLIFTIYRLYRSIGSHSIRSALRGGKICYPAAFIAVCTLLLWGMQPAGYKITMDEPVLAATALRMHEYKEAMTTARGHDLQGVFTQLDGYVDKRPFFFPFMVSLVHDLTGYRGGNAIWFNRALTPLFLGLLFVCGHYLWSRSGGYAAVLLFMTVPLLAMNANGGGFELLNLVMILSTVMAARFYLAAPSPLRLDLLVLLGLLLAQTRYESVLYVVPVAAVVLLGWYHAGRMIISPATLAAPLLLVPFPLQQKIFSEHQGLWQLKEGAERPFMLEFIPDNLGHAGRYFFNWSNDQQPNSLLLSVLFVLLLAPGLVFLIRRLKQPLLCSPGAVVGFAFSAVVGFNFVLLMAYHWGQLDDIIATRIVLPFILFQVLFVCYVMARLSERTYFRAGFFVVTGIFFLGVSMPVCARSDFLRWVPSQHECLWLESEVRARQDQKVLFVTNRHLIPLVERVAAIPIDRAVRNKAQVDLHLRIRSYEAVIFAYVVTGNAEEAGKARADELGWMEHFQFDLMKKEKIGEDRWAVLSRLTAVNWPEGQTPEHFLKESIASIEDGPERLKFYATTLP